MNYGVSSVWRLWTEYVVAYFKTLWVYVGTEEPSETSQNSLSLTKVRWRYNHPTVCERIGKSVNGLKDMNANYYEELLLLLVCGC
jgi:hypothetical protein